MQSKKLYIIGNGFDLAHGIKSKYEGFRDYISTKHPSLLEIMEKYFSFEEDWSDFESSLAELDVEELIGDASDYLESYGAEDWSDAYHHDYQYEVDQRIETITKELLAAFSEWILQLAIPSSIENRIGNLSHHSVYLSFNYTSTLEALYLIPKGQVTYIHNKAMDENSHLILGHGVNPEGIPKLNSVFEDEESDPRVVEGNDLIQTYYQSSFKSTKEIMSEHEAFFANLEGINEVYVLGHSMTEIDMPYFEEIVKKIRGEKTRWSVSYYEDYEIEQKKMALAQLGIENICTQFGKIEQLIK